MSGAVFDTDTSTRRLFEVTLALNGGRQIKTEALFWAKTPSEANQHAVRYWQQFAGSMDPFSKENIDGSQTAKGACHDSFGIYGNGSMSMNIMVQNVTDHCNWGVNLLKCVLKSRGLNVKGSKFVLQQTLTDYVDKSWQHPVHEENAAAAGDIPGDDAPEANDKKRSAQELTDTVHASSNKKR